MTKEQTIFYTRELEKLKAVKQFLDKYLIGVDDFRPLIPEIYEALKKTELPIWLYDEDYIYTKDGIRGGVYGERCIYAPIEVNIKSPYVMFYFYKNGNYDIDNDIKQFEECLYGKENGND